MKIVLNQILFPLNNKQGYFIIIFDRLFFKSASRKAPVKQPVKIFF